jgi:hypothetical protein
MALFICNGCNDGNKSEDSNLRLPENNIIATFDFDNNLKDRSANSIELQGSNIKFGLDRFDNPNYALFLNNENNYPHTNINDNSLLNLSNRFTISIWIKPNMDSCLFDIKGYIDLIGRWGGTGKNNSSYAIVLRPDGTIQARTYNVTEGNTWISTKAKINDNNWNSIIMTRNSDGNFRIFINGTLVAKSYIAIPQSSNYELFIGKRRDDRSFFYGYIDDLVILNNYVPDSEIKKLMSSTLK